MTFENQLQLWPKGFPIHQKLFSKHVLWDMPSINSFVFEASFWTCWINQTQEYYRGKKYQEIYMSKKRKEIYSEWKDNDD